MHLKIASLGLDIMMGTVGLRSRHTLYEPLALRPDHGDFCLSPSTRVEMQLSGDTLTGSVRVRPLLPRAGLWAGAHHLQYLPTGAPAVDGRRGLGRRLPQQHDDARVTLSTGPMLP